MTSYYGLTSISKSVSLSQIHWRKPVCHLPFSRLPLSKNRSPQRRQRITILALVPVTVTQLPVSNHLLLAV